ncbi:MAG TPA: ATP-binding protein [Usitatibacter sp.]
MAQGLNSLTLRRLLFAVGALIIGVNLLSAIWDLRHSRAMVERNALRDFNNLSALLADQTARSLESIGIILHDAAGEISRQGVGDPQRRTERLRDRISGYPRIRGLLILDKEGRVLLSTDPQSAAGSDFSTRQYFTRQRDQVIQGAYVSEPFIGRINHRWSFALSERITDRDGAFAGVVAAVIDIEYVDRLFRSIDLGGSGFVALFNRRGMLITRQPPREELLGKSLDVPGGIVELTRATGRYGGWAADPVTGKRLLISAAPVGDSPLNVAVGSSQDDVLAPWRSESERVSVRTLLTSMFMLALIWVGVRELTRREAAERQAQAEHERMQLRLRQAEKMEAVGRLAGGIAHDFNNILGGIMGYAEMLLEDLPEGSPQQHYARNLLVGAKRARDLVEQILTYSRTHKVARRPIDVGRIVRETLDVVRGSLPSGVVLESDIPAGPLVTAGDATQLHEVVMNLCTNAIQAMGGQGTLRIALEAVELAKGIVLTHGALDPGSFVKMTVSDTGVGMDEATLAHIFEPFFTTKEVGRGTGLGLALVYGIVADSGGAISVASRPGRGSTFEIYLPRSQGEAVAEADAEREQERGHGERILLVDDEVPLLAMMSEMLRRLGYEPEPFSDPRAALAALAAQPSAYDLVLTDEAMPGITGTELARAVREARPGVPVVIITGRAAETLEHAAREAGVRDVLLKPVQARDVAAVLARNLVRSIS